MLSILLPNHNEEKIHEVISEIEKLYPEAQIITARDRYGKGKGWAVRTALQYATGEWIALFDADGDIHPRMLKRLLAFTDDFFIVVGCKRIYKASLGRKILSFLSRMFIRIFFQINVETQTGIKIFKREALQEWKTDGFFFDVEILAKAIQRGFKIIEVPIECEITKKKSWSTLWKTFKESMILWYRLSFLAGK